MINRYLRRQVQKYLGLDDASQLSAVAEWLKTHDVALQSEPVGHFLEGFDGFITSLDRSFSEFERVVKARETSLDIAETELTSLNEQLTREAELRSRVLSRLQEIVAALDEGGRSEPLGTHAELEQLTTNVEELARSHRSRLRDIRLIFAESLRLSTSKTWLELADNLSASAQVILEVPMTVLSFASGELLRRGEGSRYQSLSSVETERSTTQSKLQETCTWLFPLRLSDTEAPGLLLQLFVPGITASQRERFTSLFSALAPAVFSTCELIRFVGEVQRRSQLEAELNTARLVQQTLMPADQVQLGSLLEVRAFFQTASECGGDWWSCYQLPEGRQLVLVGDVSGHGTASALVTALAKGFCDAAVCEPSFSSTKLLERLDALLAGVSHGTQRAMSLVVALFDPQACTCEISSAGHPPVHWVSRQADGSTKVTALAGCGDLLGVARAQDQKAQFMTIVRHYQPGDTWVLYSDGLVEVKSPEGQQFGNGRLARMLRTQAPTASAQQTRDAIQSAFTKFVGSSLPDDDVTVVVVKSTEQIPSEPTP